MLLPEERRVTSPHAQARAAIVAGILVARQLKTADDLLDFISSERR
jgi:hypothetical protein